MAEISDLVQGVIYLEQATFVTAETLHSDGGPVAGPRPSVAVIYFIAASTMAMSCSVVPPLTPTPAITWPCLVKGTPPPIAEHLAPRTAGRGWRASHGC